LVGREPSHFQGFRNLLKPFDKGFSLLNIHRTLRSARVRPK
jgi:hypothetical protein